MALETGEFEFPTFKENQAGGQVASLNIDQNNSVL